MVSFHSNLAFLSSYYMKKIQLNTNKRTSKVSIIIFYSDFILYSTSLASTKNTFMLRTSSHDPLNPIRVK